MCFLIFIAFKLTDYFFIRDKNVEVIKEMGNLKGAIGDYMYENYNSTKQGKFLKQNESPVGQLMPLKD